MSPFAALHGLRVGCVQYLNAKPLIAPYDGGVVFEHPAHLADLLGAGEIDVALIPAFEALRRPAFPVVDGVAIASRGAVYSVFLAYIGSLSEVRTVSADPASRTSSNMLRCVLAEYHGLHPVFKSAEECSLEKGRGLLLIGNQAIRFRKQHHDDVEYLDLGQEWLAHTHLPFVYAVWQIRPEITGRHGVAEALRAIKHAGLGRVREIARLQSDFDPSFAERYLTDHIRFDLGLDEKAGLARFRALLEKHGLLPSSTGPLHFV